MTDKITWHTEQRKLGELVEWDRNPRQLSKHDAEHLKKSIDNFGVADPLIINTDNHLIGGHMRRRVMLQDGYKPNDLVDVRVPDRPLTEREAEELAIRLNKNSGDWDFDALANDFEMDDLIEWGFSDEELKGLDFGAEPAEDPGAQIDKAEELREKWGVKSGQLWQLGEHRLVCGDCTDKAVVERVMGGEKAYTCITDPPYGVLGTSTGAKSDTNMIVPFFREVWKSIKSSGAFDVYMWCDWRTYPVIWGAVTFYDILALIVWNKPTGGLGNPYRRKIELVERALNNSTQENDIVYDPFLGSGTTLIACERLHRKCRAIEISPAYCAVTLQRFFDMTGVMPELLDDPYPKNNEGVLIG